MSVASTLAELAHGALAELGRVFDRLADDAADRRLEPVGHLAHPGLALLFRGQPRLRGLRL